MGMKRLSQLQLSVEYKKKGEQELKEGMAQREGLY